MLRRDVATASLMGPILRDIGMSLNAEICILAVVGDDGETVFFSGGSCPELRDHAAEMVAVCKSALGQKFGGVNN